MGDGIQTCVDCEKALVGDEIGYCKSCLKIQESESDITAADPEKIHKYAEKRRKKIREFLYADEHDVEYLKLIEVPDRLRESDDTIYAILSPELAASVDYSLIRKVQYVRPVTEDRKDWLKNYWLQKYEIELTDFRFQVGLKFSSIYEDYYGSGMYFSNSVYDYPASLIQAYVVRRKK